MIAYMIERSLAVELYQRLREVPAVVLFGPRQAGKMTLALAEGSGCGAPYLDLETAGARLPRGLLRSQARAAVRGVSRRGGLSGRRTHYRHSTGRVGPTAQG